MACHVVRWPGGTLCGRPAALPAPGEIAMRLLHSTPLGWVYGALMPGLAGGSLPWHSVPSLLSLVAALLSADGWTAADHAVSRAWLLAAAHGPAAEALAVGALPWLVADLSGMAAALAMCRGGRSPR